MLPHILHSTTRAAAVVQNQAQALRNVLQLQSSGPSSGSGSSWGNGPGPGGSKFNTGSRFHAGYNSAGRAVTQAHAITSQDGTVSQTDDTEGDHNPRRPAPSATPRKRHRIRSSSVSLNVAARHERGENLGVLQTVQIHARARHAFTIDSLASAKERLLADPMPAVDPSRTPLLVRRNSTSAPLSPLLTPATARLPTPPPENLSKEGTPASITAKEEQVIVTEPSAPQTVTPPPSPKAKDVKDHYLRRFVELSEIRDNKAVTDLIRQMLFSSKVTLTPEHFNVALQALISSRAPGEPLNAIIKLYNSMLDKSVVPNVQTYEKLIHALTTRDWEIHRATVALESRLKQTALLNREEVATLDADKARIETLKTEDNFPSAMSLFEGILAIGGGDQLDLATFNRLLRSCSFHSDVNGAIHVFAQLEGLKDLQLNHAVYQNMILTFSNAGRIQDAEEVFKGFREAAASGRLGKFKGASAEAGRQHHIQVWNAMIEAYFRADMADQAIGLVDQMVSSTARNSFSITETPVTTSSTFSTVIAGFVLNRDINSALAWFDKLLAQDKAPINPFQGLDGKAMRPDSVAWHMMLDALASHGKIDDLNRLYRHLKTIHKEDHIVIRPVDHLIINRANIENLPNLDHAAALETLQFLLEDINQSPVAMPERWWMMESICREYVERGEYVIPSNALNDLIVKRLEALADQSGTSHYHQVQLQNTVLPFVESVYRNVEKDNGELPFLAALTLSRLTISLGLKPELRYAPHFIPAYSRARYMGTIQYEELWAEDWDVLLRYAAYIERSVVKGNPDGLPDVVDGFGHGRLSSVLQDAASHGITFETFAADIKKEVLELLEAQYGEQGRTEFLTKLGPTYLEASQEYDQIRYSALENALTQPAEPLMQAAEEMHVPSHDYSSLTINPLLTRSIEELIPLRETKQEKKLIRAYHLFEKNLRNRMVPGISAISSLIQAFGRLNDLEKVRELYTAAQYVLPLVAADAQLSEWAVIEDSMIIALAHAGHPDAAHVHRVRILDQGRAPSADAYGVLIQYVRDTTDDTNGGMALFQEALERGVQPNMYLYNNIISKLSKARKADYALELFQQMKASGIHPSSITYGAVIGACARVGDVRSAEILFQEMVHAKHFKPRVPPYNTMMQLYTSTKPSRASALYYFAELKNAGVKPSAHTYKLLLDTYGTIEPVDLKSMERVFHELQDNKGVELTGHHFASLINAYGCVSKNFDKAISIFESMHTIPRAPAPDAVVFEAVINVIVAHKRMELIPAYISKMTEAGVHMTAYIANFLIKGYADVGDMDQSRGIFESLLDPPTGIAAPNNHAPHNPSESPEVPIMEPVYREPSTWEAMVRAELGAGNRDAALDLLERIKIRQYPEAVYNRISGVLTDHSSIII